MIIKICENCGECFEAPTKQYKYCDNCRFDVRREQARARAAKFWNVNINGKDFEQKERIDNLFEDIDNKLKSLHGGKKFYVADITEKALSFYLDFLQGES